MTRLMTIALAVALSACAPTSGEGDEEKPGATDDGGDDGGDEGGDDAGDGDAGDDGGSADGGDNGGDDGTGSEDGDLYINEFMASNTSGAQDAGGAYPDWIEIYNGGSETVDLGGWTISDDLDEPDKHSLASELSIEAGGFLLLYADDDEEEGPEHLSFKLAAEGESLGLYRPDGGAIDELDFGAMGEDIAQARVPDGSDTWEVTDAPTPGGSNGG